jgi:TPR repeat protein
MRVLKLIAPVVLAIIAQGFSADIGSAQAPELECKQLSNTPENGAPLAVRLEALTSGKVDSSKIEVACRSALRADPGNPTLMFQLGRALSLGNKRLEAITYYLNAADRGHAGAMTDLGGVFEYGFGVPKNLATALVWYERAADLGHTGAMNHLGQLSENGRSRRISQ